MGKSDCEDAEQCWPLYRRPLTKAIVENDLCKHLVLPRSLQSEQHDLVRIYIGDDLNSIVFAHYNQVLPSAARGDSDGSIVSDNTEEEEEQLLNFVTRIGVAVSRHEYMGSDPHVHAYEEDEEAGVMRILFHERHTNFYWVDGERLTSLE